MLGVSALNALFVGFLIVLLLSPRSEPPAPSTTMQSRENDRPPRVVRAHWQALEQQDDTLRLQGVVEMDGARRALLVTPDGRTLIVREGDIADGVRVRRIESAVVYLELDDGRRRIVVR